MTTSVQKQVLINARALIADPAHWTRCTIARTADDHAVDCFVSSATKWCAQGAIYRAAYDLVGDPKEALRIGNEIASIHWPNCRILPATNDARGHAAVLELFDKALQAA